MQTTSTLLLAFLLASASCVAPHGPYPARHAATHHAARAAACEGCGADEHVRGARARGDFERARPPLPHGERGGARRGPPPFGRGPGREFAPPEGRFDAAGGPPPGRPPFADRDWSPGPPRGAHAPGRGARGLMRDPRGEFRGPAMGPRGAPGRPPFGPRSGPRGEGGPGPGMDRQPPSPDELAAVLAELELTPEQRARAEEQLASLRAHAAPGAAADGRDGMRSPRVRRGPQVWRELLGDEAFERFRERLHARHAGEVPPPGGDARPRGPRTRPPTAPPAGEPAPAAPPREARSG